MSDIDCRNCEYYDAEDDRCMEFSCNPFSCDDPLPCESGEIDIENTP